MIKGKGFYIWKCKDVENGDPAAIAAAAKAAGFDHVIIKVADGIYSYQVSVDLPAIIQALHAVGIQVWGFHYVVLFDPVGEANKAIAQITSLDLDGLIIDAEKECKGKPVQAETYMNRIRAALPSVLLGLSSYRFPGYHQSFPWDAFRSQVDFDMPQVYWQGSHNPVDQLQRSWDEFRAFRHQLPFIPTGSAYYEDGWLPIESEILDFLDHAVALHCQAVNFWEWANTRQYLPGAWDLISGYDFPDPGSSDEPPPAGPIMAQITGELNVRLTDQYMASGANLRGRLHAGDLVEYLGDGGNNYAAIKLFVYKGSRFKLP